MDRKNILLISKRIDENMLFFVSFVLDRSYFGSYFKAKNKYWANKYILTLVWNYEGRFLFYIRLSIQDEYLGQLVKFQLRKGKNVNIYFNKYD